MSKKDKLIIRFRSLPTDFHYDEVVRLLRYFDYKEVKKGKTSGLRVKFMHHDKEDSIILHKPHPSGIMKVYMLKQIREKLGL